jgi:hypothetical protein
MIQNELDGSLLVEIENQTWKKTNYIEPHEYILDNWNTALCHAIRRQIDEFGYTGSFMGTLYRYLDIGGYRYWTCGEGINRADNRIPSRYFKRL